MNRKASMVMVPRERILIVLVAALACLGFGCSGPDFSVDSSDAADIGDAGPEALSPLLCPHCQDPNPRPTPDAAEDGGSADGGSDATMADGGARTDGGLDAAPSNDVATLNEAATLNDATAAGGCSATQKMCASSCVSLDDPKYGCGSGPCIACSADPHATYVCQAGACQATACQTGYKSCGGVCVTADVTHGCGATACSACGASHGTASCDATGKCAIACDANYKPCGGVCVSLSDPTYGCGDTTCDMTSCPAAGGATLVCSAKTCQIGTCAAGTKKCGSLCVPTDSNNGCADPARCTACGAMETCAGAPSACQCVPESMATTCARVQCGHTKNNCGTDVDCGTAACVAPNTCGGGNVANTCGCVDEPAKTTCSGGRCGGQTNNCGHPVACPATSCTAPQTCGGGSTANMCGCTDESMSTTCSGGRCGGQTNNCGHPVTCPATSCTGPQTCGGGGVANMCGCTDQSMSTTCSGGRCGTQTNNCGHSVACPACCVDEPASTTCSGGRCGSQTNNCGHSVTCPGTTCSGSQPYCFGGRCTSTPPSCQVSTPTAGVTSCGASSESCCASPLVQGLRPGEMFFRTYHDQQGGPIPTADPATVSDFRLDNYAVTVGRFRRFVAATIAGLPPPAARAGIHTHLNGGMGLENSANPGTFEAGWDPAWTIPTTATDWGAELTSQCDSTGQYPTWTATSGANENRPINCVNWYEAYAFCIWDGGFLPSATETEYAAAGGTSQRKYPWGTTDPGGLTSIGSTIDPSQAIRYAIFGDDSGNCFYPTGTTAPCTGSANIAPVGTATLGIGRWGQFDLAGNVGAWSLDWDHFPLANPCVNCANLTMPTVGAAARTGEDGYYAGPPSWLHPKVGGGGGFPSQHNSGAGGVRCARTP